MYDLARSTAFFSFDQTDGTDRRDGTFDAALPNKINKPFGAVHRVMHLVNMFIISTPITKATSYRRQLLPLVFCLVIPLYLFFPQFGLTDGENISSFI